MQASTDDDCLMRHADETGMVDAQEEVDQVKTAMFLTGSFLSYPSIACADLFLLYLYFLSVKGLGTSVFLSAMVYYKHRAKLLPYHQ